MRTVPGEQVIEIDEDGKVTLPRAVNAAGVEEMTAPPKEITVCHLEVIVMPTGEVICLGRSLGWVSTLGKFLTVVDQCRKRNP